ncbi:TIGR00730 family Rossman fold protein [uncultured Nitrospira sp.]|uniref:LOG family protein n=1 Tax=uncultured Nitrospira sp. TaxID=157176 RepID=UPI00314042AF
MTNLPQAEPPLLSSPAYKRADSDLDFLQRDDLRAVRLQLEWFKPELIQQDEGIESTIVVFGSARLLEPAAANAKLVIAEEELAVSPQDPEKKRAMAIAKHHAALSLYYQEAREFGRLVSSSCQIDGQCKFVIITGGGPGIMEAANRGAADVKAKSIGLNIALPHEQLPNPYITPELCFQFRYFALRKMHFLNRAKALVVFPGGFGTMDELFETLTLLQTGKVQGMSVVLIGRAFWEDLINWEKFVEYGMIAAEDLQLFHYAETAGEAWNIIVAQHPKEIPS